ncbi:MAG: hypothetical protein ACRCX8_05080 [Sarcina sp.]
MNPYHTSKRANFKVWIKCKEKDYHESYEISCDKFTNGGRCGHCNPSSVKRKIHRYDSLGYIYPNISKLIVDDVNVFEIAPKTNKKFTFKCANCGKTGTKKKSLNGIVSNGYYPCEFCADGISIPQKFMANLLSDLKLDFSTEKSFSWSNNKRYDFYIPSLKMIIETHGKQHYEDSWGKQVSMCKTNDNIKRTLAKDNGIKTYIEVDNRKSIKKYLIHNAKKSLSMYFDIEKVDWNSVWDRCLTSKIVEVIKLRKEKHEIEDISTMLKISNATVKNYLKMQY